MDSLWMIEVNLISFSIVYNSMSAQIKSNQFIYNLIELTLRKKYSRVIRICDYLQSQGINSHQLITIKSYAISQAKGYAQALKYLDKYEGLLINTAKIQYQQMMQMHSQAEMLFDTVTTPKGESILDQLKINNRILCGIQSQSIHTLVGQQSRYYRLVINKKQQEIINKINSISSSYQQTKQLYQSQQITQEAMIQNCNICIKSYREVLHCYHPKDKIKHLIDQYISFLANYIQAQL